jgi:hypothetical protein
MVGNKGGHTSKRTTKPAVKTSKPSKTDFEMYDNKKETVYVLASLHGEKVSLQ